MGKLALFMMVSLDGFFEGINHDLSWHNVDEDFDHFAVKQLDDADILIFGARTYEMMASFWPTEQGMTTDPETAKRMNTMPKVVFSHTLGQANWSNTKLVSQNGEQAIAELKQQYNKDLLVLGSSNLCLTFLKLGVLDELRLMVNPTVIGQGTSLFVGIEKPIKFDLAETKDFKSGNVLLTYNIRRP